VMSIVGAPAAYAMGAMNRIELSTAMVRMIDASLLLFTFFQGQHFFKPLKQDRVQLSVRARCMNYFLSLFDLIVSRPNLEHFFNHLPKFYMSRICGHLHGKYGPELGRGLPDAQTLGLL
jgi:hypothetical protein